MISSIIPTPWLWKIPCSMPNLRGIASRERGKLTLRGVSGRARRGEVSSPRSAELEILRKERLVSLIFDHLRSYSFCLSIIALESGEINGAPAQGPLSYPAERFIMVLSRSKEVVVDGLVDLVLRVLVLVAGSPPGLPHRTLDGGGGVRG